jgi:hypothetical protein
MIYIECPSARFPEEIKKPCIELFAFRLAFSDGQLTKDERNVARLFGVEQESASHHLWIHALRSALLSVDPFDGSITIFYLKLLKDIDGRRFKDT